MFTHSQSVQSVHQSERKPVTEQTLLIHSSTHTYTHSHAQGIVYVPTAPVPPPHPSFACQWHQFVCRVGVVLQRSKYINSHLILTEKTKIPYHVRVVAMKEHVQHLVPNPIRKKDVHVTATLPHLTIIMPQGQLTSPPPLPPAAAELSPNSVTQQLETALSPAHSP